MRTTSPIKHFCVAALFFCVACSGEAPPPPAPPTPPAPVASAPPPPPSAEPAPSAAASAEPEAKPKSSGRPPVIFSNPTELTETFGSSPGAKVEIGADKDRAVFRIPENALHVSHNIGFRMDSKGKSGGGQVGKIYHVIPNIPPSPTPVVIESPDIPFTIGLANGGRKDLNLAVGRIGQDDKGREKIVWTIYAAKTPDDGAGLSIFEVPSLGDEYVHLTSKPPDAKK
jgi:hypothetical protein